MKVAAWVGLFAALIPLQLLADSTEDVKAWNDQYWQAWNARDIEGVANLYSEDVEIIWPYQEEHAKGRAEFKELLRWEFSFPSSETKLNHVSQEILEMGDGSLLVIDQSDQTFGGPDGNPMTVLVRSTALYKRIDGQLLVVREHASIAQPFDSSN